MKQLVRQIEMTPPRDLVAGNQHRVQFRQTACRAGDPPVRVNHENEDSQLPFHDIRKAHRRHLAKTELGDEPLPGTHRLLETGAPHKTEGAAHERCLAPDLRRQRAEHRNPAARPAFVGFKVLQVDTGLTPRKTPFAGEQEGIGEVLERRVQPLDREHKFLRGDSPGAGLYG